ncbi:hypothetical protein VOLCADRAFT_62890 [Volvox carteri f. nagariensis]|uniref:Uncharacterized protein n=1 Tax=Volvox carteri f. nagariensis TaxID=3068 RepID=D8U253_VOLCA|nr:uncharacterized protein VOLCADRAFT_62890 [Volvox carteri f. nagariensis]EFJ46221.1 hypothetical protein VOLCADRAFT_62890 [Volvox carteri f. nagariensis]|eukprot:XP_002952668.1 hypothetical protein VOLCADRAFT_62890 [Volvox carteri f. nagariensis]
MLRRSAACTTRRNAVFGHGRAPRRCRFVVVAALRDDVLLRSLSTNAEVSVLVVDGTKLVSEAQVRHKLAPTATAALGRSLLGALLMGSFRKEDEQVQITFQGDGEAGSILAIADTRGNVKGKVNNPAADPPLRPDGKLNVGAAVGKGVLAVVRSHPLEPQPYTGMVPIVSGEVAEDLANYLVDSEQTNSALGLGVSLDRDCRVKSAGGWLVQILPFCSEETLAQLEQNLTTMPTITTMLNDGMSVQDITARILDGLGVLPDGQTVMPKYGPCEEEALKKRMIRAVAALGKQEVADIIKQEGKLEVTCDLCQQTYQFSQQEIDNYIDGNEELQEVEHETTVQA